jgi:hypothetical protein
MPVYKARTHPKREVNLAGLDGPGPEVRGGKIVTDLLTMSCLILSHLVITTLLQSFVMKAIIPGLMETLLGIPDMTPRTMTIRHIFEDIIEEPIGEIGLTISPLSGVETPVLSQESATLTRFPMSVIISVQTLVSRIMTWIRRILFR